MVLNISYLKFDVVNKLLFLIVYFIYFTFTNDDGDGVRGDRGVHDVRGDDDARGVRVRNQ
jgi:hypothetical protein